MHIIIQCTGQLAGISCFVTDHDIPVGVPGTRSTDATSATSHLSDDRDKKIASRDHALEGGKYDPHQGQVLCFFVCSSSTTSSIERERGKGARGEVNHSGRACKAAE